MTQQLPPAWMKPYPFQIEVFKALQRGVRKFLLIWPRRAGKDLTSNITGAMAYSLGLVGPGSCIYMFPEKDQGRRAIWDAHPQGRPERYIDVFPNIIHKNHHSLTLKFEYPHFPADWDTPFRRRMEELDIPFSWDMYAKEPCKFEIHDADVDSMVGGNQNVIICSEYGLPAMAGFLDYVRPILKENNGILILNGTVRGKNHMYSLYNKVKDNPEWFVSYLTNETALDAAGNPLVTEEMIQEEIAQGMNPATARQEYTNDWELPVAGAYYEQQMMYLKQNKQLGAVPWDPTKPVYTGWDLGITDQSVIWFAQANDYGGLNIIDYESGTNANFTHWLGKLREGRRSQYIYGLHFMPHDVAHVRDTGDAKASPESRLMTAYKLGFSNIVKVDSGPGSRMEGISQVAMGLYRCFFDVRACENGLNALRNYHSKQTSIYNADGQLRLSNEPYHDEASDPADAFRILIVGYNAYVKPIASGKLGGGIRGAAETADGFQPNPNYDPLGFLKRKPSQRGFTIR